MLSLELMRREPEIIRQALSKRDEETKLVDQALALDTQRRALVTERDNLRGQHNEASRKFGSLVGKTQDNSYDPSQIDQLRKHVHSISKRIQTLESETSEVEARLQGLLLELPNIPLDSVPVGLNESGNVVVRVVGEPPSFDFTPLEHWTLGEQLRIIDFQRGVKLSGSRFFVLRDAGAKLERALINFCLDVNTKEQGYTEMSLPVLLKEASLVGSGNLPKFGENLYRDVEEDLWLSPTAEVPLTNLHRDEILMADALPLYYTANTTCFRREKASAGRDTRGIKRVHQFNKVEMYKFVTPEESDRELERLVADAEGLCRRLGLVYRVLELCTGDLSFQSAQSYDIEVWSPGCNEWLEVSSCSNCTDFQARRANIRYRPSHDAHPEYLHTINGSGLALPRIVIAILESYQQADGSVRIPEVLSPYMGMEYITPS